MLMLRVTFFLLSLALSLAAESITFEELSHKEKQEVYAKNLVLKINKIEGAVWPEIHVFSTVEATPLESIAIFLALDIQKNYVPGILVSDPIKHLSPTEVYTRYIFDLPWPIPNSEYIHGSNFKKISNGYRANWYMVKSDTSNSLSGFANFFTKDNKTIFHYSSSISPKSFFASLLKGIMIKDSKKTIAKIIEYIEHSKKESPLILKKYVSYINRSLSGENVYQDLIDRNKKVNR